MVSQDVAILFAEHYISYIAFVIHILSTDMSQLWPAGQRGSRENVLNGIALGKDHVLLTGKRWDRMYKVKFPDWPSLGF